MNQIIPQEIIEKRIYVIGRQKVMIDRDLAELYEVETRALNQAVKRNIKRFPADFMISLNREEIMNLSQIVISSKIKHAPKLPFRRSYFLLPQNKVTKERWPQVPSS